MTTVMVQELANKTVLAWNVVTPMLRKILAAVLPNTAISPLVFAPKCFALAL